MGKHYLEFMHNIAPILKEKPSALIYNGIDVNEFRKHLVEEIKHPKLQILKNTEENGVFLQEH